jgi:hypothetical protein
MEMPEDSAMLLTLQINQRNLAAPALVDLPNSRTKQKERAIAVHDRQSSTDLTALVSIDLPLIALPNDYLL